MLAKEVEQENNIIDFKVYANKNKSGAKLKLDGTKKKTHTNTEVGISNEVYAFKSREEINVVMEVLNSKIINAKTEQKKKDAFRNKLLFVIGMNIGIRVSDIRTLKWSFFFDLEDNGSYKLKKYYSLQPIKTKRTGKYVKLFFNDAVQKAIYCYIEEYPIENIDDYIFTSSNGKPITTAQMWNIIKKSAKEAGIKQNIGSHSLRKTFGRIAWEESEDKEKELILLQEIFKHSSPSVTKRYIGITDEEISEVFYSVNIGMENI